MSDPDILLRVRSTFRYGNHMVKMQVGLVDVAAAKMTHHAITEPNPFIINRLNLGAKNPGFAFRLC